MHGWVDGYLFTDILLIPIEKSSSEWKSASERPGWLLKIQIPGGIFRFLCRDSKDSALSARSPCDHFVVRLQKDCCRLGHSAGYSMALVTSSSPSAVRRWSGRGQGDWGSESSDFSSLRFGFPTLRRRILISHRDAVGWKKTPGTQEAPKDCIISSSPQWQLTRPAAGPQDAPQNSSQEQRPTVLGDVLLSL